MCGIVGCLGGKDSAAIEENVRRMAARVVHRGPDDAGTWIDAAAGVGLGHRRLAIVDLSTQGHQPMRSTCGRYVVVFNGEIYNHLELRMQLAASAWRGTSDTETLLACFTRYGVTRSLPMLVGMFAFAVWDCEERRLTLARDRMGEKPLYYGTLPSGELVFASELKALTVHSGWRGEVDRDALALFMRHNCVPAPWTIYRSILKLQPGYWLSVGADGRTQMDSYWSVVDIAARSRRDSAPALTDEQAADRLESLLTDAVHGQMLADVPLGAFLSGGVDSSTIVALMARGGSGRVRTFSIGFQEPGYSEAEQARAVAEHLGTDHTEWYVTARDALDVVPRLPFIYDEPFGDSSQVPTLLVSQMARKQVTVALSGDAGDELFAGYSRYLIAQELWKRLQRVPSAVRNKLSRLALGVRPSTWDTLGRAVFALLPRARRIGAVGDKVHKFADNVLPASDLAHMYRALVSHWQHPEQVVLASREPRTLLDDRTVQDALAHTVERMCLTDQLTYLPDDILVKVDRASMAVSLETRAPYLDHRVVEFAWQTPMHQKVRNGQTKWLLRQVLYKHVPRAMIERPKQGFAIPLGRWLREPLRDWAEELLSERRLNADGYFATGTIRQTWKEHLSGVRNHQYALWDVLMFQSWLEANHRGRGPQ